MASSRSSSSSTSSSKKSAATKSPAKKSTKKSTAKKSSTTSASRKSTGPSSRSSSERRGDAPRSESRRAPGALQVATSARDQLSQLTGQETEVVTGVRRTDDGWAVEVEVVETRRIPDTTDVLATYEVLTDEQGDLQEYRRTRRYVRGATEKG